MDVKHDVTIVRSLLTVKKHAVCLPFNALVINNIVARQQETRMLKDFCFVTEYEAV